ncbi:hypothetical protein ACWCW7_34430 [Nocardia tengchongensis]
MRITIEDGSAEHTITAYGSDSYAGGDLSGAREALRKAIEQANRIYKLGITIGPEVDRG